jgi:uncharacterized YigZ family protein
LNQAATAEQTINKSRFIAYAAYCADEAAVAQMLRAVAAKNASASHLAYAYRVKTNNGVIQRFSDAGEPSGTAGKPILQLIEGRDLMNIAVGVIRYYGGINLGTGGLARAYGGTAKLAIEAAGIGELIEMQRIYLQLPFNQLDYFSREIQKLGGSIISKQFSDAVEVEAELPQQHAAGLLQRFTGPV